MIRVVGIDHISLRVGDFEKSKAFYGKLIAVPRLQGAGRVSGRHRLDQRQDAATGSVRPMPRARSTSTALAISASTTTRSSSRAARTWTRCRPS